MDEEDKQDLKSIGLYYFDLPVGGGGFWPPIIEDDFGGVLIKWFVNSSRDAQIGRLYGFDDNGKIFLDHYLNVNNNSD